MYDLIVIGAGPAGLTAAIYARRNSKTVLVLERGTFGGQVTFSPLIENYPGFPSMSGNEFADKLVDQALSLGADIEMEEVTGIVDDGDVKKVVTTGGVYECRAVIIANGVKHRKTGLLNEDSLVGNGISYCAVCDGAFFKNKDVAVLGGGNSALQEIILLSQICESVTVIQNLAFLTGEEMLKQQVLSLDNVKILYNCVLTGLNGREYLTSVEVRNNEGETTVVDVDGLFVAIGLEPENDIFSSVAELTDSGYFSCGESCETKTPGVFVAGDCRNKAIRQISTATSDGAVAAMAACRYLASK
ncbi:MAG: FAD-dependent oxidoreductase [Clostridiales bacterium]|nr:FAD-dependent oxidoreductase [Clostridiales bacterium]